MGKTRQRQGGFEAQGVPFVGSGVVRGGTEVRAYHFGPKFLVELEMVTESARACSYC